MQVSFGDVHSCEDQEAIIRASVCRVLAIGKRTIVTTLQPTCQTTSPRRTRGGYQLGFLLVHFVGVARRKRRNCVEGASLPRVCMLVLRLQVAGRLVQTTSASSPNLTTTAW
jgi:hypothetical protein